MGNLPHALDRFQRDKSGDGGRNSAATDGPTYGARTSKRAREVGRVSTPPVSTRTQLGLWFVVCNVSPSVPSSQSELNISAAGKYIGADLDLPDAGPREPEVLLLTGRLHAVTTRETKVIKTIEDKHTGTRGVGKGFKPDGTGSIP